MLVSGSDGYSWRADDCIDVDSYRVSAMHVRVEKGRGTYQRAHGQLIMLPRLV